MTIFEALRADHDVARRLLDRVAETHGASDGRGELFGRLRAELEGHAAAEEQSLYAAMMQAESRVETARHGVAEHKEIDDFIEQLAEMDHSNPNWIRVFEQMRHRVEHHMEEEEKQVFVSAGQQFTDAYKAQLAQTYANARTSWEKR